MDMDFLKFLLFVVVGISFLVDSGRATLPGDFCSDISFWDAVQYKTESRECCDTVMKKNCEWKKEERCEDVTEMKCQTVGYAECSPKTTFAQATKCTPVYKDYAYKDCQEVKHTVPHRKQVPECKQVTKNNCVTDWEVDGNGNKVWAGTEKCTPVSWEECKIVEKNVDFPAVKTECNSVSSIKWNDFVEEQVEAEGVEITCEVKAELDCKPVTSRQCATVEYQECGVKAADSCQKVQVKIPSQEKVHQKKCLT